MTTSENNTTYVDVGKSKKRRECPELVPINDLEVIHKLEEDYYVKNVKLFH